MTINDVDISTYGLSLLNSKGVYDVPELKTAVSENISDASGVYIGLTRYKKHREIFLEFLLTANGYSDYLTKIKALKTALISTGTKKFNFDFSTYNIYLYVTDQVQIERLNGIDEAVVYAKVRMNLVEKDITRSHINNVFPYVLPFNLA